MGSGLPDRALLDSILCAACKGKIHFVVVVPSAVIGEGAEITVLIKRLVMVYHKDNLSVGELMGYLGKLSQQVKICRLFFFIPVNHQWYNRVLWKVFLGDCVVHC